MRTRSLALGAIVLVSLADCASQHDDAGSGGATSSGGATASGGRAHSGGASTAGTPANGGATAAGGTSSTGGNPSASGGGTSGGGSGAKGGNGSTAGANDKGGQPASAGSSAGGAPPASGGSPGSSGNAGTTASGGNSPSAGTGGGGAPVVYRGPCDLLSGGCAEAYSLTRAMTSSYKGPLFQLGLAADKNAKTLDIGQTDAHTADMSTWKAYCGDTPSKCVISKIYAQIHTGSNDLLPAIWNAPWGPNCSAGGYTCAAKFNIEMETGLPILKTVAPQEYALSGDAFATGVNGGSKEIGLMYNGKPVPNQVYCCGVFGISHKYNANDTHGTDFMVALAYGWKDSGGCCIAVNCGKANSYCVGAEEEENNDIYDYGSSPIENALVVTQFDPTANAVVSFMNGKQVLSHSPPKARINAGTAVHLGGGGDLSQPDPVVMREAFITNALMSAAEVTALKANSDAFYPTLKFP